MRTEADLRRALAGIEAEAARVAHSRRVGQSYKVGLFMAGETLRWALGENESHPYENLLEGKR